MSNQLSFSAGSAPVECATCHSTEETVRRDREFLGLPKAECCDIHAIAAARRAAVTFIGERLHGRVSPAFEAGYGVACIGNGLFVRTRAPRRKG
jgi:hypothetical protein